MYKRELITDQDEDPLLTTADVLSLTIPEGVTTNLIMLRLNALQDGATQPTLSDFLNQIADSIVIKVGQKTIMNFDPVEYHEYLRRKLNIEGLAGHLEGTGADNDVIEFSLPIVLLSIG